MFTASTCLSVTNSLTIHIIFIKKEFVNWIYTLYLISYPLVVLLLAMPMLLVSFGFNIDGGYGVMEWINSSLIV